jgi:alcohol dehydrogenase (NADP+)
LIADPDMTRAAVVSALETGFRLVDCAEQHRNEAQVGAALKQVFAAGQLRRQDVFVTTKLWNSNHRPERVKPAFEASLKRLGLDKIDLYLIQTPFAFEPGADDPQGSASADGFDMNITLPETWAAMEALVDEGKCGAIGLSNVGLDKLNMVWNSARIKPAVIQVEAHPHLPQDGMLAECRTRGVVLQAFAPLGHALNPGPLHDALVQRAAKQIGKTPAQVLLAWALKRGTSVLTSSQDSERIRANYDVPDLPDEVMREISLSVLTRRRCNSVTETGIPSFNSPS